MKSAILLLLMTVFSFQQSFAQVTKKENRLLSRRKRFLLFPKGSNFVFQWAYVKPLMKMVPKGVQYITEVDLPFPLPYDLTPFEYFKKRKHRLQRREVFERIQDGLDRYGLNGNACVKRILCDADEYIQSRGKSLVKDLLSAVFSTREIDDADDRGGNGFDLFEDSCHNSTFVECPVPLLGLLQGSLSNYT